MNEKKKYSPLMKFSLLSASLLLASALSIASAVPEWEKEFPGKSASVVELIATTPALSVIVFLLLSNWIAGKIGSKNTVIVGLLLSGVAGLAPIFINNFYVIIFTRLIFGAGLGLVNGLAVSMIGRFFKGHEKNLLMGYRGGLEMLGDALCSYLAGTLLVHAGTHSIYLIYLLFFPIALLFFLFVPEPPKKVKTANPELAKKLVDKNTVSKITKSVLFWAILLCCYQVTFVGTVVRITGYIVSEGLGNLSQGTLIFSVAPLFGLLGGLLFGKIYSKLHRNLLSLTIIIDAAATLVMALSSSFWVVGIAVFIITFCDTLVISFGLNIAIRINHPGHLDVTTSILLVGSNIGIFIAPMVLGIIQALIPGHGERGTFLVIAGFLLLMSIVGWYKVHHKGHKKNYLKKGESIK